MHFECTLRLVRTDVHWCSNRWTHWVRYQHWRKGNRPPYFCRKVVLRVTWWTYFEAHALRFPGHQNGWVSDWVREYAIFRHGLCGYLSNRGNERNEIWHKGRTLNTRIAQRKRAIPHSTMKNNSNIIEWCNDSHQGAPRIGKLTTACASDLTDARHVTRL